MKTVRRVVSSGVVLATACLLTVLQPASAVGPYTIYGGSNAETHVTERAFVTGDGIGGTIKKACDAALLPTINGIDGYVLDISWAMNRTIFVDYQLLGGVAPVGMGSIQVLAYSGGCAAMSLPVGSPGNIPPPRAGTVAYFVPVGAKWLVVNSTVTANVVFSVR